jgi:chromosome segregation ATPase
MWMICLRTHDTLKERFTRIHDLLTFERVKDLEVETDSHQEQINDLHEKIESYKEESRVKFADLERQCDLYRKFTYHVIELKDKHNTMTKQLEALQSWVDLYRKTRGI